MAEILTLDFWINLIELQKFDGEEAIASWQHWGESVTTTQGNKYQLVVYCVRKRSHFLTVRKCDLFGLFERSHLLAQRQVKPDGEAWEEGELVDIRLAEDLKRRRQKRRSR